MKNNKQLKFTNSEQNDISNAVLGISSILLKKMDKGVGQPELSGVVEFEEEGRKVEFSFVAKHK